MRKQIWSEQYVLCASKIPQVIGKNESYPFKKVHMYKNFSIIPGSINLVATWRTYGIMFKNIAAEGQCSRLILQELASPMGIYLCLGCSVFYHIPCLLPGKAEKGWPKTLVSCTHVVLIPGFG